MVACAGPLTSFMDSTVIALLAICDADVYIYTSRRHCTVCLASAQRHHALHWGCAAIASAALRCRRRGSNVISWPRCHVLTTHDATERESVVRYPNLAHRTACMHVRPSITPALHGHWPYVVALLFALAIRWRLCCLHQRKP